MVLPDLTIQQIDLIFEFSREPLCIVSSDGFFLKVNHSFAGMLGYSREELLSIPVNTCIHPDDLASCRQALENAFTHQNLNYLEIRFRASGGDYRWLAWNFVSFGLKDQLFCLVRDITAQKEDQQKLLEILEQNKMIMDSSVDVICSIDENGFFIQVSRAAINMWGYTPEELVGRHYIELIHPDDYEKTREIGARIRKGEHTSDFENRYIRKDGRVITLMWSASWNEKVRTMFCIARDMTHKKEQEEQIRLSERRFRGLVQSGSDMIGILSAEGEYLYVSPTVMPILGYSPQSLIGKSPFEFIHPDDVQRTQASLARIAEADYVEVEPFRFKHANGVWVWIETNISNKLNDPAINGIVVNSRDVTRKKEVEDERLRFSRRLDNIIENYTDGFFILTKDWKVILFNPMARKMTGLAPEELLNADFWSLFPEGKNRKLYQKAIKAFNNNQPVHFEEFSPLSDKWFEITAYPYEDTLTVFFKDTTQQKKDDLALQMSEENYRALFADNPVPMWAFDYEMLTIQMVNDAALELYGYTREEFLNLSIFDLRPSNEHEEFKKFLNEKEKLSSKRIWADLKHVTKDGRIIYVDLTSHIIPLNGKYTRLIAVNNVTEKRLAEDKLREQNIRLKEIAQISSHEVRRPVASILGLTSLFNKTNPHDPLNHELIEHLRTAAAELDEVIHLIVQKTWKEDI